MSEVTFGQGQLEELAKFTDPQNEIIANLAKALLSTTKQRNEFAQQLSELQLSQQNIINSFGIKGEGAHSKLVIEYVHGLVAEKSRIAAEASMLKEVNADVMRSVYRAKTHMDSGKTVDAERALQCAIGRKSGSTEDTDAAIDEIKSEEAQNMYESILDNPSVYDMESLVDSLESYAENKKAFAANLRAGSKCNIPPAGWSCTRTAGHDGPCAAVEDASHE